jgi:hypothetical protein
MHRSLQIVWTVAFVLAACRRHPIQASTREDGSDAVAQPAAPGEGGGQNVPAADADGDDNLPDLIEVVGTAPQLMMLPSVAKIIIEDHGQTPLARGRWKIFAHVAVRDTPAVLKEIRALGMKATVPLSVAQRKQRMQPAPATQDGQFIRP